MNKKGSALVFSVLMLAFFLALSLNIFFQARKKAERAGVKVAGERTTNNIDMASSLGYQELRLADTFVRLGFPYSNAFITSLGSPYEPYPDITGSTKSSIYLLDDGSYLNQYPGIQINNFIDYFSSQWNIGDTSSQKIIVGEEIEAGEVERRMWLAGGVENKLIPLWSPSATGSSIGGYTIKSSPTLPTADPSETTLTAVYEKFIRLNEVVSGSVTLIPESVFRIEVTESFTYSISGGVTSISDREITDFIIESINK